MNCLRLWTSTKPNKGDDIIYSTPKEMETLIMAYDSLFQQMFRREGLSLNILYLLPASTCKKWVPILYHAESRCTHARHAREGSERWTDALQMFTWNTLTWQQGSSPDRYKSLSYMCRRGHAHARHYIKKLSNMKWYHKFTNLPQILLCVQSWLKIFLGLSFLRCA
jgi:hypothetical protein